MREYLYMHINVYIEMFAREICILWVYVCTRVRICGQAHGAHSYLTLHEYMSEEIQFSWGPCRDLKRAIQRYRHGYMLSGLYFLELE